MGKVQIVIGITTFITMSQGDKNNIAMKSKSSFGRDYGFLEPMPIAGGAFYQQTSKVSVCVAKA